jgi:glycosyltransferase involved in cell wall biosynthesis
VRATGTFPDEGIDDEMSETPLRICLLTYRGNPRSGGQGIYVRLLSRELALLGHEVEVWSGPPYPDLVDDPRIRLVQLPSLDLWNEDALFRTPTLRELRDPINRSEWGRTMLGGFAEPRTFTLRALRRYRSLEEQERFDIVHDNQCLGIGLLELQRLVPLATTIHHPITRDFRVALASVPKWNLYRRFNLWRWFNSFLPMQVEVARGLERVLTISHASARDIIDDFGIDSARCRMVSNGINLDVFQPKPDVARRPNKLITTLSADVPLKGISYLLEALAELRKEQPDLELTVIGSPRRESGTADLVHRLGLESAVHFTGRVQDVEIARRYAESTVAVVSSLYEGFGFPAGEAMACEIPLVSTRGGALPEVVGEGGDTGVLVEPGSVRALAAGIRAVLDASPDVRTRMGKAARARVIENFTWRRTAERHVEAYRELIDERAHARGDGRKTLVIPAPTLREKGRAIVASLGGSGEAPAAPGQAAATALSEAIGGVDDPA